MGENKVDGQLHLAMHCLQQKLDNMSAVHYDALPFIIAYTASGAVVQFHSVFWDRTARKV